MIREKGRLGWQKAVGYGRRSLGESAVVREVPSGWGPFRFASTSSVWLGDAEGIGREILVAECWGWTADEAAAKAREAVDGWKRSKLGSSGLLAGSQPRPRGPRTLQGNKLLGGTPAMLSHDTASERGGRASRFLHTLAAGLAGVLAAALFLGAFDGGLPRPVHAEVPAAAVPRAPGLCFHGAGGELLDFTPAGQGCRR